MPTHTGMSCAEIQADWQQTYDALVADNGCTDAADCHAPFGACQSALGGCQEAVSTSVTKTELQDAERAYLDAMEAAGCDGNVQTCDCYGGYAAICVASRCELEYVGYY